MENERLKKLFQFLEKDPDDAFTRYAIALEFQKTNQTDIAIGYFMELAEKVPSYIGTYYQLGHCFEKMGQPEKATEIYKRGIEQARKQNNQHTLAELQNALMKLELGDDI